MAQWTSTLGRRRCGSGVDLNLHPGPGELVPMVYTHDFACRLVGDDQSVSIPASSSSYRERLVRAIESKTPFPIQVSPSQFWLVCRQTGSDRALQIGNLKSASVRSTYALHRPLMNDAATVSASSIHSKREIPSRVAFSDSDLPRLGWPARLRCLAA